MQYNIVMFAYNEADNIEQSIKSIFDNTDDNLNTFYILANGCTDQTVIKAAAVKQALNFEKMHVVEIVLGDKCNAWNTYIHDISTPVDTHFFTDADVRFSTNCFPQMNVKLAEAQSETMVIAGMPLSGRNIHFYKELITQRACFFGNLYGIRQPFIDFIKTSKFRLPIGLNWIDSFLTKAVNTNLTFSKHNLPHRTTWIDNVGYEFDSLVLWRQDDINLYVNRIARYELGKLQEVYLDQTPVQNWPSDLSEINQKIWDKFDTHTNHLSWIKKCLVFRRLKKIIRKQQSAN